ncbi:MAG: agmatine deiminase family protein, partial [Candidatus Syntrophosphaera sp.]
ETDPPQAPVRPIAEFEPASHVLIRYPLGIPVSLVVELANTAEVVCIVSSSSSQSQAESTFNSAGVDMDNVSFLIAPTDSYWTRDYGPWFVFDGNDNYGVVDFRYNRPRPNDNLIPQVFANQNDHDYYGMNLYQTGGNYMTDGINTAAQTTIAYSENSSLTPAQVDAKMQDYLGITSYHVLQDPNNTYIDHIDCWGKFLAPDKVLIRSVPESHPQYDEIEQTADYFANLNCAWGYPYKVYRVNTPQNQPYTNSLILNDRVFVPIMNSTYDNAALQAYEDAMPGYDVLGIASSGYIAWESTDALHCRTHEIPDMNMLHISHMPYFGELPHGTDLDFNATIKAHSGQPVYADSVYVRYRLNQDAWQNMLLTHLGANDYTTSLGGFVPGDTIRYYIHAADQSGRSADHPRFAELDPHVVTFGGDIQAPVITHEAISEIQSGPTVFMATVTDNEGVAQVSLRYKVDDGAINNMEMESLAPGSDMWYLTLDLDFNAGDMVFHYQFEATDTA